MKPKKRKRLSLGKATVANLNKKSQQFVRGGAERCWSGGNSCQKNSQCTSTAMPNGCSGLAQTCDGCYDESDAVTLP